MIIGKRGVSDLVVIMLIVFVAIACIVILYTIIFPMLRESSKDVDISKFSNTIEIASDSVIYNKTSSKLEVGISKMSNYSISYIQAVVFTGNKTLIYNLFDIPGSFESRSYILNVSNYGAYELLVYPVFPDGKIGIGERKEIIETMKKIDDNLVVINPSDNYNQGCVSDWDCQDFSICSVNYNLDNLLLDEMILKGEQTRMCNDKNGCNTQIAERKECDDRATITIKKVNENGKNFAEIYDVNNNLMSKIELIPGEQNVLNIELPLG